MWKWRHRGFVVKHEELHPSVKRAVSKLVNARVGRLITLEANPPSLPAVAGTLGMDVNRRIIQIF
ncbi:hypothetical protein HY571_00550, partial [Candidatus Micrarchaeota archaeon]|nr:hypothetical protein [Candidatus Micrarchaeota archaeon]